MNQEGSIHHKKYQNHQFVNLLLVETFFYYFCKKSTDLETFLKKLIKHLPPHRPHLPSLLLPLLLPLTFSSIIFLLLIFLLPPFFQCLLKVFNSCSLNEITKNHVYLNPNFIYFYQKQYRLHTLTKISLSLDLEELILSICLLYFENFQYIFLQTSIHQLGQN